MFKKCMFFLPGLEWSGLKRYRLKTASSQYCEVIPAWKFSPFKYLYRQSFYHRSPFIHLGKIINIHIKDFSEPKFMIFYIFLLNFSFCCYGLIQAKYYKICIEKAKKHQKVHQYYKNNIYFVSPITPLLLSPFFIHPW